MRNRMNIENKEYEKQRDNSDIEQYEETLKVSNAMIKYGGSFVCSLGKAIQCADFQNIAKIKYIFAEYWEEYLKIAEVVKD